MDHRKTCLSACVVQGNATSGNTTVPFFENVHPNFVHFNFGTCPMFFTGACLFVYEYLHISCAVGYCSCISHFL